MIGSVVGNYRITEKIGEGGMGAVFKGIDMMLEREVAIKVLRPEYASQPELVERFRSEAVTLAKLNHPNIATLHGFFRQGNDFFMVMEFLRGEPLDSIIERSGAMPVDRAVTLFCHALEGIGHAHSLGIIHRDIKPANIMLTDKGVVKVMDFGIARVLGTARMTRQGSIVGTIAYMSPEQIQGFESDARADIYSLGILLYEMLTGRVPFINDTEFSLMMAQIQEMPTPPRTFAPHIPPAIEQAIMRSLNKQPEARFQSVSEFRSALEWGQGLTPAQSAQPRQTAPPTRLATDPSGAPLTAGDQMRETRLAPQGGYPPPYSQPGFVQAPAGYGQPYAPQTHASLFSRLNWMHYAGAAIVLIVLLATPFALMSVFKQASSSQKPAAETRPAVTPSAPPPAAEPQAQPLPGQTATQPLP
ncbi:MAG TPA: protein kinase, partial [Blastocatellia bacterium]|nr:protein kinase [Blastocatellia bacterium]